jgi:hypothetical protein
MHAGFEVLTAVVRKGSVFWDITPCKPMFCRKILRPSSGLKKAKQETSVKPAASRP